MTEIELPGLTADSALGYLASLGLLKGLASHEEGDPEARLWWRGIVPVLRSRFDSGGLLEFFVHEYRPSPIVSPWNAGAGFSRDASPVRRLAERARGSERLRPLVETIDASYSVVTEVNELRLPSDRRRARIMALCRARWPDEAVAWLDVAAVLRPARHAGVASLPLLGRGGSDARQEFSVRYLEALGRVLPELGATPGWSRQVLRAALFLEVADLGRLLGAKRGFSGGILFPVSAEAPNAAQGPKDKTGKVNPWSYILALEGCLLLAGGVHRRHQEGPPVVSFPFSVEPLIRPNEETLGEVWLPLWERPAALPELEVLFREGRLEWGGRPARKGVDAFRAVAALGIDRGISRFQRFVVVQRMGKKNHAAVPIETVRVPGEPARGVHLLLELDSWLERIRRSLRDGPPRRVSEGLYRVDAAMAAWTRNPSAPAMQDILVAAADLLESMLAVGSEAAPRPRLTHDWLEACDDGSAEFRLAAALASLQAIPMRDLLFPRDGEGERKAPALASGLASMGRLATLLYRRALQALQSGLDAEEMGRASRWASWDDLAALLDNGLDEQRLARLVRALSLVGGTRSCPPLGGGRPLPLLAILKAAAGLAQGEPPDGTRRLPDLTLPNLLLAGRLTDAVMHSRWSLRARGLVPLWDAALICERLPNDHELGARLLVALYVPVRLNWPAVARLCRPAIPQA